MTLSTLTDAELDEAVAREVMGWKQGVAERARFTPSTSIVSAWGVVEKMRERTGVVGVFYTRDEQVGFTGWVAAFDTHTKDAPKGASTAPRAICEAALMAVRGGRE